MKAKILVLLFLSLTMSISLWGYDFVYNGIYYNILSGNTSVEVTYENTTCNSYSGSVSYRFVKWSDDNEYNPRIFVARNDLTLEAIREEAPVIDDVENVQADTPAFYIIGNTIYNPDNELLRVYSAEGKLIKTSDSDVNMECYPKGIYMVVDNRGNAIKVPVR